jgi:membrane-associated phospholipid phosphatase
VQRKTGAPAVAFNLCARDRSSLILLAFASLSLLAAALVQLGQADAGLFIAVNHVASEYVPDELMSAITMFGELHWQLALLSPLLLIAPRVSATVLYGSPLVLIFTHVPKLLLHRARPSTVLLDHGAHLIHAPISMNTFPSGHSVVAGMIAAAVVLGWDVLRQRPWTCVPALAGVVLLGGSRIAVGAHWPSDVLAGAGLGIIAGYVGVALAARFHRDTPAASTTVAILYGVGTIVLAIIPTHSALNDMLRNLLAALGCICVVAALTRGQLVGMIRRVARARRESLDRAALS